ncbi:MAG TPA: methylmalonyl Co-A mutase-associated GTPase MeaB [Methylomirabilota bacterium]|nr:methylmalonyl Co-A mutase-associated GTPase MeaB [Methylomirabilota bacterium]
MTAADLAAIRAGGKPAVARALAAIETRGGLARLAPLLDCCLEETRGQAIGLTGPPGVGKSTLTDALVRIYRGRGESVGVVAVDPSSRLTGGALLGDRTRVRTDPEDAGVFVRSMAARDRLGGLSDAAAAAVALMGAVYDKVLVESVGIGQSEADVATVADTVVLCIQPGSGDSVQFMKAGVMEIPDVVAVTKADTGAPARRAAADVLGALSLGVRLTSGWTTAVLAVSATTGEGLDALAAALDDHVRFGCDPAIRAVRRRAMVAEAVRAAFGGVGLAQVDPGVAIEAAGGPFSALATIGADLERRLRAAPAQAVAADDQGRS